jgi:hypothetical protein
MDVVDAIKVVKTGNRGNNANVPVETVTINSVTRLSAEEGKKLVEPAKTPAPAPAPAAPAKK